MLADLFGYKFSALVLAAAASAAATDEALRLAELAARADGTTLRAGAGERRQGDSLVRMRDGGGRAFVYNVATGVSEWEA